MDNKLGIEPAHVPGLLGIAAMEIELSQLMGGGEGKRWHTAEPPQLPSNNAAINPSRAS
ncbi:MAG: hypothetical protein ABJA49_16600 [Betaproteobacteria bacterium]